MVAFAVHIRETDAARGRLLGEWPPEHWSVGLLSISFREMFLGQVDALPEHRVAIELGRHRQFQSMAPLAAVHSLLNTVVLTLAFWNTPVMPIAFVWSYASAVLAFVRIRDAKRFHADPTANMPDAGVITRNTTFDGIIWGAILAALIASSGAEHDVLLGVLTAGVICVGAFLHSSFPAASLGFSLCVAVGAAAGLWIGDSSRVIGASVLLIGYVAALQRFAAVNAVNFVRRQIAAAKLQESEETIRLLLHDFEAHSADWLWRIDATGRLSRISGRFAEAAGLPRESLEGASFLAMFAPEASNHLAGMIAERRAFRDQALEVAIDDRTRWWSVSGQPAEDGGYRGVCTDITSSRDAEARIAYFSQFDGLTDLPNRALLVNKLEDALRARAGTEQGFALLVVDLDNFKAVNDTMGHPAGDAFLKAVAERLSDCIGASDLLARLGGDEFAILQSGADKALAEEMADQIVDALLAPVTVHGKEISAGGSVGIAVAPQDGEDPAQLMKNAELALYRAKADGRGCARFFEPGMDSDALSRAELEADLRSALANDAMDVYFQPLVNTRTHQPTGYETLLRWRRPGHGLVSPAVFISCAEETGLIVPLGEWVIRRAIHEAAQWKDEVSVAINLSPAQMKNPSLISTVVGALAAAQLDPARLEIEITESVLMQESDHNIRTLHALKDLGVRIALDDFGTGYSSLSYLQSFPFDKIKIDQRFVRDIDHSHENQAIVRAVISLARDLGMRVTAEGVETEQQAAILSGLGCSNVQGYLYSRPVPAEQVEKKLLVDRLAAKVLPMRLRKQG